MGVRATARAASRATMVKVKLLEEHLDGGRMDDEAQLRDGALELRDADLAVAVGVPVSEEVYDAHGVGDEGVTELLGH